MDKENLLTYRLNLERAGIPSFDLGACRIADFESETLDFHHLDLSDSTVECYISEYPDAPERLATLVVTKFTETKTYQAFIDECRFEERWIPCGEILTDEMTSSIVNISSAKSTFANLPRAATSGAATEYYYTLKQSAPGEQVILAGRFILTEAA